MDTQGLRGAGTAQRNGFTAFPQPLSPRAAGRVMTLGFRRVRDTILAAVLLACATSIACAREVPDKTVVLTFDDAVKSHVTVVAPLLKEMGFGATFFVTQAWMKDAENFMSWEDIARLHAMGFEIGNHSWTHGDFGSREGGAKLGEELEKVERELARVGVPKPISFAWCGNMFGPEGIAQLQAHGYKLARRGMQPEYPYGSETPGQTLDVTRHHPLLIPTTGDAYPYWTLGNFKAVVATAGKGKTVVLQFHGAPDTAHPWVNTPPENLRAYLSYLKQNGYRAVALRDILQYYDPALWPQDPLLNKRLDRDAVIGPGAITPRMRAFQESLRNPSIDKK